MEYQQKMKEKKMKSPNYMEITLESKESLGYYGGKDTKSIYEFPENESKNQSDSENSSEETYQLENAFETKIDGLTDLFTEIVPDKANVKWNKEADDVKYLEEVKDVFNEQFQQELEDYKTQKCKEIEHNDFKISKELS